MKAMQKKRFGGDDGMICCNKDMDGEGNACPACGAASRESGNAGAGVGHIAALPQRPEHAEKSGRRLRPLNALLLKLFAAAAMLADHVGMALGYRESLAPEASAALRALGRAAFPLFCFLLVTGFERTSDRKKYLDRLLLAALAAQIPFALVGTWTNYAASAAAGAPVLELALPVWEALLLAVIAALFFFAGRCRTSRTFWLVLAALVLPCLRLTLGGIVLHDGRELNVLYTLVLGFGTLLAAQRLARREADTGWPARAAGLLGLALALALLGRHADFGLEGVALIFGLYLCRERRWEQAAFIGLWGWWRYSVMMIGSELVPLAIAIALFLCRKKNWAKIVIVVAAAAAAYLFSGHGGEAASAGVALAGVLVLLYNGERGPGARWFYLFYPAHMLILGVWNLLF